MTPHPYLLVTRAIHLPSLAFTNEVREHGSGLVLRGLLRHLGGFLEPFGYDESRDRFVPRDGKVLPRILCGRDSRLMADYLIQATGFYPCGTYDRYGFEKFKLDFSEYNAGKLGEEACRAVRRGYRLIKNALGWETYLG